MSDDPWGTSSDDGYREDRFYTRATDKQGHGVDRRVKISPDLDARLAALIASRKIPAYLTVADVLRDALVHRLMYLDDLDLLPADLVAMLELQIAQDRAVQVKEWVERQRTAVEQSRAAMEIAHRTKVGLSAALDAARRVLQQVEGTMHAELSAAIDQFATAA